MRYKPVQHIKAGLNFGSGSRPVGDLALRDQQIYFEYDADFIRRGLALSPFQLPLKSGLQTSHTRLFESLPGVFNDSLPDGWGRLLFDRAMRKRGILPQTLSPLDRLAYVGKSGMGALIYEPDHSEAVEGTGIDLDWLAQQSQDVLEGGAEDVLDELLALNGSSAGARPKAFIGFNRKTGHVTHGRQNLPKGYEPWLVKFANSQDGPDAGAMELVYSEMARQAGLMIKARTKRTVTAEKAMSFASLMEELSGLCRLVVVPKIGTDATPEVVMVEKISATQKRAFKLLNIKLL